MGINRGCHQNDSLADGKVRGLLDRKYGPLCREVAAEYDARQRLRVALAQLPRRDIGKVCDALDVDASGAPGVVLRTSVTMNLCCTDTTRVVLQASGLISADAAIDWLLTAPLRTRRSSSDGPVAARTSGRSSSDGPEVRACSAPLTAPNPPTRAAGGAGAVAHVAQCGCQSPTAVAISVFSCRLELKNGKNVCLLWVMLVVMIVGGASVLSYLLLLLFQ